MTVRKGKYSVEALHECPAEAAEPWRPRRGCETGSFYRGSVLTLNALRWGKSPGVSSSPMLNSFLRKLFAECPVACHGDECMPYRGGYKGERSVPLILPRLLFSQEPAQLQLCQRCPAACRREFHYPTSASLLPQPIKETIAVENRATLFRSRRSR